MAILWLGALAFALWWACYVVSRDTVGDFAEGLVTCGGLFFLSALAVPGYGAYHFLKNGTWQAIPLRAVLAFVLGADSGVFDSTGWVGLDMLAIRYLETSVGWTLMALGFVFMYGVLYWANQGDLRRHAEEFARKNSGQ